VSAENETEADDALPSVDLVAHLAALSADRERLTAENAELQDLLKRRQADFENSRRRAERDRSEFLQFAGMELVR
jgi:molecular chaperone GrpE